MNFQYIQGLYSSRLSTDGIFLLKDHGGLLPPKIVCSHKFRKSFEQQRLNRIAKECLQEANPRNYVIYPIIDIDCLSKIDIRADFENSYENDYPYLFVHRNERNKLLTNLNLLKVGKETLNQLDTSETITKRHQKTLELIKSPEGLTSLYQTISNYSNLYREAYQNDRMLQTLARNVFVEMQRQIVVFEKEQNLQKQA